jgi:hypothetical protein
MTKSFEFFHEEDWEREYLKEQIFIEELRYIEELEYRELQKNVTFEVKETRKVNSKYGRAKILTKTKSPIRKICQSCKHKSKGL